ncbi:hypothetical protein LXT21_10695 [Myxococcus sp. K38C18041901]|uniref:hypothetical protein n=1 Tax=Myxococcus guangdongensis TaxID=2906760 RepID=UPI0020A6E456|nr:hypothetical protein [Myxococcus guangdongensis]MCP3059241.1 hypothetical protein [Myxococcus guangdongensis]
MAWPETASPYERRSIIRGMRVRDEGGALLGYVAMLSDTHLYLRRWPFSRKWGEVPMARVRHVSRGAVELEGRGLTEVAPHSPHGEITTQTLPLVEPGGVPEADAAPAEAEASPT